MYLSRPAKLYRKESELFPCVNYALIQEWEKNDHFVTLNQTILSGKGYQWMLKLLGGILLVLEYHLIESLLIVNRKMYFNEEVWWSLP